MGAGRSMSLLTYLTFFFFTHNFYLSGDNLTIDKLYALQQITCFAAILCVLFFFQKSGKIENQTNDICMFVIY